LEIIKLTQNKMKKYLVLGVLLVLIAVPVFPPLRRASAQVSDGMVTILDLNFVKNCLFANLTQRPECVKADVTGPVTPPTGPIVTLVATSSENNNAVASGGMYDTGTYKITFDVRAVGGDIYIDGDTATSTYPTTATDGLTWATTTNSFSRSTAIYHVLDSITSDTNDITIYNQKSYFVQEGDTRRFTLIVKMISLTVPDAQAGVRIMGIKWDTDAGDQHANLITTGLGNFQTNLLNLRRVGSGFGASQSSQLVQMAGILQGLQNLLRSLTP